jgi:hypothetical protein
MSTWKLVEAVAEEPQGNKSTTDNAGGRGTSVDNQRRVLSLQDFV